MKAGLLALAFCLVFLGATAQSKDGQMRLTVVDSKTALPLAGVKVRAWSGSSLATDAGGACSFPLPAPGKGRFFYRITMTKPGYVAKYVTWSQAQNDKVEDIPSQYTAQLDKGVTIGGIVKNQKGEPVQGARVIFSGVAPTNNLRERITAAANYHAERTDDQGRWQNNEMPADFREYTFRVIHPDYVPSVFGCQRSDDTNSEVVIVPETNFLTGTAAMILTHGIEISGIVLDPAGKPVPGVTITRNHEWRNPAAVLTTGDDGRFNIANLRSEDLFLTFQAQELAAETRRLSLSNAIPELKIEMKPGNHLQGKVVDSAGKPIAGAHVETDRLDLGPLEYDWSSNTDDDGRFLWDSAPDGKHPYFFGASGYRPRAEPELVADGSDKIIVLRSAEAGDKTMIDGRVADAGLKTPITNFTVCLKEFTGDGVAHSRKIVSSPGGEYSVSVDPSSAGCMIEITAPGYAPQMSNRKACRDGDQGLDFTLTKGDGIRGTVYLPDGKPAAGADVAVCTEEDGAVLGHGHILDQFQNTVVTADDNGEFIIPEPAEPQSICAVCEAGIAETNISTTKGPFQITLAPWGAIQGIAIAAGKLLQGEKIALLRNSGQPGVSVDRDAFSVKTGVDGSFMISNVPPGNVALFRVVSNKFGSPQLVDVNAGQTTGAANTEIDFGKSDIPAANALKPGDIAPAFEVKTLAGQPLRLSDYKGKYVLLDFWATWCGPCVAEIPYLKSTYNAFGSNERFVMISLSLDDLVGQPAKYTRNNGMKWSQGFLGPWEESKVTPLYGVDGIPSIFLIDPDGKIIDRDLRGDEIHEAVEKALGK